MLGEEGGGCPDKWRTKGCSKCDRAWKLDKKSNWLSRWGWRPRQWISLSVILLQMLTVAAGFSGRESTDAAAHYTPQWAVHIEGGHEVADRIAMKHGFVNLGKIFEDLYHFEHKRLQKRSLTPGTEYHSNLMNEAEVKWAQQQVVKRRAKRDLIPLRPRSKSGGLRFNDVEWPLMWYLNRGQGLDMNVQGAWQEGISGKGVVVTILDDGLEKNHPDLVGNYDPQASYDVNSHDEDPMPRYDPIDSNRHGTRCAGEVAAVANNTLCSVGVAFGASVGGVRMLDGDVTDAVEARSLSLNPQHIDIYSASWGPDDDGKTVDGPGELATRAFIEGVTKGRQGKGSIFVWASGNGGREHDNCNCDGYTNSIWTLSISSATENGLVPWYSEACSSTLATTYSSGSVREKQIVTTDLRHKCTNGHTGTSASAPLAAGICALALEANRDLTWRDMQHIVVRTARPANLKSPDWKVNGVGRNVSHSFGYGLMDATAMVKLARTWKTVPEQHRCEVSAPHVDKLIPARSKVILNLNVTECAGVNFLEHVQAKISLSSSRRGDLQIYLTSPAGTRSTLLAKRPQDSSRNPFNAWPFMSVHTWGEMPFGIWQLEIHNEGRYLGRANLQEWSLLFYGTLQIPTGMAEEKPSQQFASRPAPNKSNVVHVNPKSNKNSFTPNYVNRKNYKNWKSKSTTSRVGKVSNAANGTRTSPTVSPKYSKTTQKSSKTKEWGSRTSPVPLSTHSMPLTIVLGPIGNQKVPDVFQKYPKVQQLFPLYVNSGRIYEENFLIPRVEFASSKTQDFLPKSKGGSFLNVQKAERQNRFDTSSLLRTSTEGKVPQKKPPPRNHQNQGHFEGWQMLFYGTEDTPNGEALPGQHSRGGSKGKNGLATKVSLEDDVPNHLEPDTGSRGWKDQATRRDDMMRTTTDPLGGGSSSGCALLSTSASQCIAEGVEKDEELLLDGDSLEEIRRCLLLPSRRCPGESLRPQYKTFRPFLWEKKSLVLRNYKWGNDIMSTLWKGHRTKVGLLSLRRGTDNLRTHVSRSRKQSLRKRTEEGGVTWKCSAAWGPPLLHCVPPGVGNQFYFSPVSIFIGGHRECVSGLYLYEGRCEAKCPPNTYPEIDAKERTTCMPCHYTCMTCAGEADGQCTSCHDEAVPMPSGMEEPKAFNLSMEVENLMAKPKEPNLSWGRRAVEPLVTKRAVTKKILEPYAAPRTLFYCYPARVVEEMNSGNWYRRMTVLFALNILLMLAIVSYFACSRFCQKRKSHDVDHMSFRYSKMNNGDPHKLDHDSILYVPSSSEEE